MIKKSIGQENLRLCPERNLNAAGKSFLGNSLWLGKTKQIVSRIIFVGKRKHTKGEEGMEVKNADKESKNGFRV